MKLLTNLRTKTKFRAGTDATFGNRQAATSEIAATCARQRRNLQQFDCHAEVSQTAHAEQSAVGIPDIGSTRSRSEPSSLTAPPRRVSTKSNLILRSRRSFAKRPELNRDSFVFASTQLHKIKQLQ